MATGTSFTRRELYNRIWLEPVQRVARELGISDVGLAKLCRRHNIPRPPRGYWAKKKNGHRTTKITLPRMSEDETITIAEFDSLRPQAPAPPPHPEVAAVLEFEADEKNQIALPGDEVPHHPLVERTRKALEKPETKRSLYRCLDVRVGDGLRPRALRIMDAIVFGFVARRFKIVEPPRDQPPFYERDQLFCVAVEVDGKIFRFSLTEKMRQVKNPAFSPTKKYPLFAKPAKFLFESSGLLYLQCKDLQYIGRYRWIDTPNKPLESQLNDFMLSLSLGVINEKIRERASEADRLKREEDERQRREEHARIRELLAEADEWFLLGRVRRYVRAIERRAGTERDERVDSWIRWARRYLSQKSPVRQRLRHLTADSDS